MGLRVRFRNRVRGWFGFGLTHLTGAGVHRYSKPWRSTAPSWKTDLVVFLYHEEQLATVSARRHFCITRRAEQSPIGQPTKRALQQRQCIDAFPRMGVIALRV